MPPDNTAGNGFEKTPTLPVENLPQNHSRQSDWVAHNHYFPTTKTYDIYEAAQFLKIDRSTALDLAGSGELPGAKVGRAWVFLESDLVAYLEDKVRGQTMERREVATLRHQRPHNLLEFELPAKRRRARPPPPLPDVIPESGTKSSRGGD